MEGDSATTPFGDGGYIPDPLAQFLSRVLPTVADPPDSFVTIHAFGGTGSSYHGGGRAFAGLAEYGQLQNFVRWLNHNESDVFFCLSTQRHDGTVDGRGNRKVAKGGRGVKNARLLKSLVLDLDVKPGAYPSQRAALAALLPFCEKLGLDPLIVSSGRGIHAYLVFNTPVTVAVWQPLANRLISAAQGAGLKFDVAVTRNPATLLRLPTSFNHKDRSNPLECRVLTWGSPKDPAPVLSEFPVAAAPRLTQQRPTLDPTVFPPRPPINGRDTAAVRADLEHVRIVTSIDLLRDACPVVADSDERGGDGDREPLWFELAKLCHYVEGGQDYFHDLSSGDARYDTEQTDQKYQTAEPQGWPACATIAAASTAAAAICQTCPHNGQGRSPINFARAGQANGTMNGHAHPAVAASTISASIDLPENLQQLATGHIMTLDGQLVFNSPILEFGLISHPDGAGGHDEFARIVIPSALPGEATSTIETSCSTFASGVKMAELVGKGLTWPNLNRARESGINLIAYARANRAARRGTRYGWLLDEGKIAGFGYAGTLYTPVGPQRSTAKISDEYTPSGSFDEWKQAANLYVGKGLIEMETVIATGFAAPLMHFTRVDGVTVFARSAGSGVGKTAAMETGNSVWARRDMVRNDATPNSIMDQIMQRKNYPVYRDEMVPTQYKYQQLIKDVSSGKEKSRLDRNSNAKPVRTACTMLVAAANSSMQQGASETDTNAQFVRILELEIPDTLSRSGIPHDVRAKARQSMQLNYGIGGVPYAEFIGRHHEAVNRMVGDTMNDLTKLLQLGEEDRFWVSAVAAILVGAAIAKKLGLIDFDTTAMRQYLLGLLRHQKASMQDLGGSADDPDTQLEWVAGFLNENINAVIVTKEKPAVGRGGAVVPLNAMELTHTREFVGRLATEDKWLAVSERAMKKACKLKPHDYMLMKKVLTKAGYCVQSSCARSLGAQCNLKNPPAKEYVLEFDLTNPANERFLPQ